MKGSLEAGREARGRAKTAGTWNSVHSRILPHLPNVEDCEISKGGSSHHDAGLTPKTG